MIYISFHHSDRAVYNPFLLCSVLYAFPTDTNILYFYKHVYVYVLIHILYAVVYLCVYASIVNCKCRRRKQFSFSFRIRTRLLVYFILLFYKLYVRKNTIHLYILVFYYCSQLKLKKSWYFHYDKRNTFLRLGVLIKVIRVIKKNWKKKIFFCWDDAYLSNKIIGYYLYQIKLIR